MSRVPFKILFGEGPRAQGDPGLSEVAAPPGEGRRAGKVRPVPHTHPQHESHSQTSSELRRQGWGWVLLRPQGRAGSPCVTRQGPGLEFKRIPQYEHSGMSSCSPADAQPPPAVGSSHRTHSPCTPPEGARPLQARLGAVAGRAPRLACSPSLSH